jgi:predicted nucleic acid-binding protein
VGQYLIDNNAISLFFSGLLSDIGMNFMEKVIDETPNISVITEIEALSWINTNKSKEQIVRDFVKDSIVLALTPEVVNECVRIRRRRKIKTPDAIIAATAVVHKLILVTNDSDFKNIDGLQVIAPNSF